MMGMMGISDVLPMYPGYALGGIITEANLYLPLFEKKQANLYAELTDLKQKKAAEEASASYKAMAAEDQQRVTNVYAKKILTIQKGLTELAKKIQDLIEQANPFPIEESLPLDPRSAKIRSENRSFKTERLNHLLFSNKSDVLARVQGFVSQLFLQDAPLTVLPRGTLEAMAHSIENLLGVLDSEVTLVGSFITLERVKMIDPLVIRPNARIRKEYVVNAEKYYVLTEAVLGGVFLGLGKSISAAAAKDGEGDEKWKSSLLTISFISQGAIPKLNHKLQEVNLWEVYNNWKETLLEDPESGYPIGFKVRSLQNVLEENHLTPE